ncbi:MAG: transposase [Methylocystis sp.]
MDRAALDSLDRETLIRLILSQAEMIARLTQRVAELEATLNLPKKTPENSSTPPSKGQKPSGSAAGKDEGGGAKKRGKSHPGAHRPLHPNPTENREIPACACQHCGADVSQAPQVGCEAYDHIEIPPIKPDVTRVALYGGTCPDCGKKFKAARRRTCPRDRPSAKTCARSLSICASRRTSRLSGCRFCSPQYSAWRSAKARSSIFCLPRATPSPRSARLLSGTILQSDETGLRVGKDNWYLWVFHHKDSAVFVAKSTRAQTVIGEFLGDFSPDYWVSDRYSGQLGWAEKENQVCLAHLIRDVQYAIDCGDDVIGPDLRHLLGEACKIAARRGELSDATLKSYACRLEARLDKIMARTPTHPAGVKLKDMIKRTRRHLFVFMTVRELPTTNNGPEQAIRAAVIFRKVTYCFRSAWGAELYADIRSVIETGRRRAIDGFEAIRLTRQGKPLAAPTPS